MFYCPPLRYRGLNPILSPFVSEYFDVSSRSDSDELRTSVCTIVSHSSSSDQLTMKSRWIIKIFILSPSIQIRPLNPYPTHLYQNMFVLFHKGGNMATCWTTPLVSHSLWSDQLIIEMLANKWNLHFCGPLSFIEALNPYSSPLYQPMLMLIHEGGHMTICWTILANIWNLYFYATLSSTRALNPKSDPVYQNILVLGHERVTWLHAELCLMVSSVMFPEKWPGDHWNKNTTIEIFVVLCVALSSTGPSAPTQPLCKSTWQCCFMKQSHSYMLDYVLCATYYVDWQGCNWNTWEQLKSSFLARVKKWGP